MKRKRISFPKSNAPQTSSIPNKGHFIVYTTDKTRFTVPLEYLGNSIFRELLRMSEEEFGLPTNGPITLPCDSAFLRYVLSLLRRTIPEDLEKALLTSLAAYHCLALSSSSALGQSRQTLIYGY